MDNDFDSPTAIGIFFQFVSKINQHIQNKTINFENANSIYEFLKCVDEIFQFLRLEDVKKEVSVLNKDFIEYLIEIRETARKNKNWEIADNLRDALQKIGIYLEDTKEGVVWKRK